MRLSLVIDVVDVPQLHEPEQAVAAVATRAAEDLLSQSAPPLYSSRQIDTADIPNVTRAFLYRAS